MNSALTIHADAQATKTGSDSHCLAHASQTNSQWYQPAKTKVCHIQPHFHHCWQLTMAERLPLWRTFDLVDWSLLNLHSAKATRVSKR